MRSYSRYFLLNLLIILPINAVALAAENIKVYSGEYVIRLHQSLELSSFDNFEYGIIEGLSNNFAIVRSNDLKINNTALIEYKQKDDKCNLIMLDRRIESCSPNFQIQISTTPNDTGFSRQWGARGTKGADLENAWDIGRGSKDIVVAVVDTGIDLSHPDLIDNLWTNTGEIAGNGIDDDSNGYIDDIHGISVVSTSPQDDNGHGTHVAGIIGAVGGNEIGVAGVNWRINLMAIKFLNSQGGGSLAGAIKGLQYVHDMKVRGVNIVVANNSWGGGLYSAPLYQAIKDLAGVDVVFTAAAGNSSNDNDREAEYPSSYNLDNIVAVAAHDASGNLAYFSSYGFETVDISAPGSYIYSTYLGGGYAELSGTSMATPFVSGAIALLHSVEPGHDYSTSIKRLYRAGVDGSALTGLVHTGRYLNVARMLRNEGEDPESYKINRITIGNENGLAKVLIGEPVSVRVYGEGNGTPKLALAFGNHRCRQKLDVTMSEGYGESSFIMPNVNIEVRTVAVSHSTKRARIKINGLNSKRLHQRKMRAAYRNYCKSALDSQIGA